MNNAVLRWALGLVLAGAIGLALALRGHLDVAALERWVAAAGVAGPLLFMLIYAAATVLFLPGSVLTLAGGALFGPFWGTLWNLTGATVGAALAFLVARYLAADWVERRAGQRLQRLNDGVAAEGWRFVAFVRLVPLLPFNLLNYALGLTRIRFSAYVIASWVFMLPGAVAYTYLGYAGREAVAGGEGLIQKGLVALAVLAAVAFLPRLVGKLRERPLMTVGMLRERLDRGDELLLLDVRNPAGGRGGQSDLAGARRLPLELLPDRIGELGPYLERCVVVIDPDRRRQARAALLLAERGFADVHVLRGGIGAWPETVAPVAAKH